MLRLDGHVFPALSARRLAAVLDLRDDGDLDLEAGEQRTRYASAEVEISEGLGGIPRGFRFPDGSKFECEDQPGISEWLEVHQRQRSSRFVRNLERRWRWALVGLAVVALTLVVTLVWGIPAAAGWIALRIPVAARVQVGNHTETLLSRMVGDEFDPGDLGDELDVRFHLLASGYPSLDLPLELRFLQGGAMGANAFAIPNGTVVMTEEFIELAQEDLDALTGVLAHELGHLDRRHGMERAVQSASLPVLVSLVTGDLGSGAAMLGGIPVTLINNGYGREQEREADLFAKEAMERYGFPTQPVSRLFAKLDRTAGDLPRWLSTHPGHRERAMFFSETPTP